MYTSKYEGKNTEGTMFQASAKDWAYGWAPDRTETNWYRTRTGLVDQFVDQYGDESDQNCRKDYSISSSPTIYRDGSGPDPNGIGWTRTNRDGTTHISKNNNFFSYLNQENMNAFVFSKFKF